VLELTALGAIAFFLASGTGRLLAGSALTELPAPGIAAEAGSFDARADREREGDTGSAELAGAAILARNIFDSAVGPLGRGRGEPGDCRLPTGGGAASLAPCDARGVAVLATVSAEREGGRSFALLEHDGDRVYRGEGQELDGRTVETIGWRYVVLSESDGRRCYLDIHGGPTPGGRPTRTGSALR
jgi:hypothetical protein